MTPLGAPALARAVVAALIDSGVRQVVICPGSRSAPLTYALAAAERCGHVSLHVRIDERVAAFTALGLAKSDPNRARPVAVLTTSGTATANLHPAVLEASIGHWPLIALTADRPPEMHGIGANQTCDQDHLYGGAARGFCQIEAPESSAEAADGVRARIGRSVALACGADLGDGRGPTAPGPVQINVALRDPLTESAEQRAESADWWRRYRPTASLGAPHRDIDVPPPPGAPEPFVIPDDGRPGLVIAGDDGPQARTWAEASGWPLVAEPSSGALGSPNAVGAYRLLLSGPLADRIGRVVVFGRPTLSRPVTALLNRPGVDVVVCRPATAPVVDTLARDAHTLAQVAPASANPDLAQWIEAGRMAYRTVRDAAGQAQSALRIALACWQPSALAAAPVMVVGASNSIRDLDLTIPLALDPPRIVTNRGLAGIDGTISTAIGLARGTGQPVRAIVGDLTLLHDVGALAIPVGESAPPVQIVCANDGGGSIFATLEHGRSQYASDFERFFATAQQVDLAPLARAYGWGYRQVTDLAQLPEVLAEPLRCELVDVQIDRRGRHRQESDLRDLVQAAIKLGRRG